MRIDCPQLPLAGVCSVWARVGACPVRFPVTRRRSSPCTDSRRRRWAISRASVGIESPREHRRHRNQPSNDRFGTTAGASRCTLASGISPGRRSRRLLARGPFDLAVTHFFLDSLDSRDAEAVILKVTAMLAPSAGWLVSEFQVPKGHFRRLHARLWLGAMYWFFRATTGLRVSELPPYRDLLKRAGFTEVDYRERRLGLIRSQVWTKNH